MPFDANYAATPGRPVNLRRDIGVALGQLPSLEPIPQESGPPTDYRERATAAASSIANSIDPNTPSAFGQFAGGLARGFAGVQSYLQAVTGQREAQQERQSDRALATRRAEAGIASDEAQGRYYDAKAQEATRPEPVRTPTPAADQWEEVRGVPVGQPRLQRNRRTGQTKPVLDPQGRPLRMEAPPVAPRRGGGGTAQTKTPAQWVAEVRNDTAWTQAHPNATPADIAAEARKRAGQ